LKELGTFDTRGLFVRERESTPVKVSEGVEAALRQLGVEIGEWCNPAVGPKAELQSLLVQHADVVAKARPVEADEAVKRIAAMYPKTDTGWGLGVSQALQDSDRVQAIYNSVKRDSSPGLPWVQLGKSNRDVLDGAVNEDMLGRTVAERLARLARMDPDELRRQLDADPLYAVKTGLCDPVRVMIKRQVHALRKKLTGKWRVIFSQSIADQLVEKMITWNQDDAEKRVWRDIPSKAGMGLTDDSFEALSNYAIANWLTVMSDAGGFDVSLPEFLLWMDVDARILQANDPHDDWVRALRNFSLILLRRVITLSDGRAFVRTVPGGMSSGRSTTASSNSRMRGLIHTVMAVRAGKEPGFMAMGDDCVERKVMPIEDLQQQVMDVFGVKLTDLEENADEIVFCSHRIRGQVGVPDSPERQIAAYILDPAPESFMSLTSNLRHHPKCEAILEVLRGLNPASEQLTPEKKADGAE